MSAFAAALTRIRTGHQLSISALQARVGAQDAGYISRLETGTREPSRAYVERLCVVLACTPEERYELLTSAGYHCDIVVEHELLALNALLQDERIDPLYRDSVRTTVRSLVVLAERERAHLAQPRSVVALRRVG